MARPLAMLLLLSDDAKRCAMATGEWREALDAEADGVLTLISDKFDSHGEQVCPSRVPDNTLGRGGCVICVVDAP